MDHNQNVIYENYISIQKIKLNGFGYHVPGHNPCMLARFKSLGLLTHLLNDVIKLRPS